MPSCCLPSSGEPTRRKCRALWLASLLTLGLPAFAGPPACPLVTPGLVLHLEADLGVTVTGSSVIAWIDQSPAGNDLVAGGAPQLLPSALNGRDVIRFDGVDDFLERTAVLTGLPVGNANRTAFVVANYASPGFGGMSYGTDVCNQSFGLGPAANGNLRIQAWCPDNDFISENSAVGAGWQVHGAIHQAGQLSQYRDGFWIDTATHDLDTQLSRLSVGQELNGSVFAQADIAAVLIYDRALTSVERSMVETYLLEKYLGFVCGSNLAPHVDDVEATVGVGQSVLVDPVIGAQDRDGTVDPTSVSLVTPPTHGMATIDPVTGSITYVHGGSPSLLDAFSFTVVDDMGAVSNVGWAHVSIGSTQCPLPPRGLVLLLESGLGVSVTGAQVTGWMDQSLHGNDLVAFGDPTLQAGALGTESAIQLDGMGDTLERSMALHDFPAGNSNRSMFVLVRYQSTGLGGTTYGNDTCNQAFGLSVDPGGDLAVTRWCNDLVTNFPGSGAGWIVQSAKLQFGRLEHYLDSVLIDVRSNDFATVNDRLVVGAELDGSPQLVMDVAAILLYDRALAPLEHQQVVSYLQTKYLGAACGGNANPTADVDFARVVAGQSVVIDVLDGDSDDGQLDPTTVSIGVPPARGTVMVDPQTGVVTYTRTALDLLADRFTYTVRDNGSLLSNEASVFVAVDAVGCPLVTDGLVVHLEAGVGVFANGSTVLDWADASGLGNDLVGRDGPTLVPNALNGHPVVRLDGVDDFLERDGLLNGLPQGASDRSLFYVVNYSGGGPGGLGYGTTSCNRVFSIIVRSNGTLMLAGWCGANSFATTELGFGGGWFTHSAILDANTYSHYKAGSLIDSAVHVFNTGDAGLVVGSEVNGNTFVEMDVAEVLIYDRALDAAERWEVEAYLNEKYFAQTCCVPAMIVTQPAGQSPCLGDSVTLSVSATGTGPLSYQWRKDGVDLPGAQAEALVIGPVSAADPGVYDVLVTNSCGTEASASASLVLLDAVTIVTGPQDVDVCEGAPATLTVVAQGSGPLSYQWFRGGVAVAGATDSTLTIDPAGAADVATYTVTVAGACGSAASAPASLMVRDAPQVLVGPVGSDPCEGMPLSLTVIATGSAPLSYQWSKDGSPVPGANAPTLDIAAIVPSNAGVYSVEVSNSCGTQLSSAATVVVRLGPTVDVQPMLAEGCVGSVVTLSVQASGAVPLGYQWRRNGANLPGANGDTLVLDPLAVSDTGSYSVQVSNPCGTVTSDVVSVSVLTPPAVVLSPASESACVGDGVTFAVTVSGSGPLAYQWRRDGAPIAGAATATLLLPSVQLTDVGSYDVEITNPCGMAISAAAVLNVLEAPAFTAGPVDTELCEGEMLTLTASATGPGLLFQWQKGGVLLIGQQSDSLVIDPVLLADAGSYELVVTNTCGSVSSSPALVTVRPLPSIVVEPVSNAVCENDALTLTVSATGFDPLSYEWRFNGVTIPGASGPTFTIDPATPLDVGIYDVVVSNVCGSVASTTVMVSLLAPSSCGEVFKRGDVNQDGTVNIVDALAGLNYLFVPGSSVPQCLDSMDANDDGQLNLLDPVTLLRYLFIPGSALPEPPGPLVCGLDPTPDALATCDYTAACP